MKRFLSIALFSCILLPSVFAQSNDLIKYDKEVLKAFIQDRLKNEESLNLNKAQLELLKYKLEDYIADFAQKQSFGLTQQQISDYQDSTRTLAGLRKDVIKLNKTLVERQGDIDQLKAEVQNLKQQRDTLQKTARQLKGYRDVASQIDDLKNQYKASEEKYQSDLKKVTEDHDKEMSSLKEKHNQEVAGLNNQLMETRSDLSDQRETVKVLQSQIDDLTSTLKAKNEELAKWQGGVESVLAAIEGQCSSAKEVVLSKLDPASFQSSVNSFEGMRRFVQEIDPQRVSAIDRQIEDVGKLMKVGEVFKDAVGYIQGHQDAAKAQEEINQLNKVRNLTSLSADQVSEMDALLTALKYQDPLYRDLREFLSGLRTKNCLPTREKIEEQLKLIGQFEDMLSFMVSPEYHKTYVAAIGRLKENLQKAADNDRTIAPIVKDDATFPGLIDEIIKML